MSNTPDNSQLETGDTSITMAPELSVEIVTDSNVRFPIPVDRLRDAATAAAADQGFFCGEIGIRFTDDVTIHRINLDYLGHDYPTDVISFDYGSCKPRIEGEMVISVDTAVASASELGWSIEDELLLYVIHGTLHVTGLDDLDDADRVQMRAAERRVMLSLGIDAIDRFSPSCGDSNRNGLDQQGTGGQGPSPLPPHRSEESL